MGEGGRGGRKEKGGKGKERGRVGKREHDLNFGLLLGPKQIKIMLTGMKHITKDRETSAVEQLIT